MTMSENAPMGSLFADGHDPGCDQFTRARPDDNGTQNTAFLAHEGLHETGGGAIRLRPVVFGKGPAQDGKAAIGRPRLPLRSCRRQPPPDR